MVSFLEVSLSDVEKHSMMASIAVWLHVHICCVLLMVSERIQSSAPGRGLSTLPAEARHGNCCRVYHWWSVCVHTLLTSRHSGISYPGEYVGMTQGILMSLCGEAGRASEGQNKQVLVKNS